VATVRRRGRTSWPGMGGERGRSGITYTVPERHNPNRRGRTAATWPLLLVGTEDTHVPPGRMSRPPEGPTPCAFPVSLRRLTEGQAYVNHP